MDEDPLKQLTPGQRVRTHIIMTYKLLEDLESKTSSRWTGDQIIAVAQIHALLAIAAALGDPDGRR